MRRRARRGRGVGSRSVRACYSIRVVRRGRYGSKPWCGGGVPDAGGVSSALAAPAVLDLPPGAEGAAKVIERPGAPVRFLADDLLEGRGSSRGGRPGPDASSPACSSCSAAARCAGRGSATAFEIVGDPRMPRDVVVRRERQERAAYEADFVAVSGIQGLGSGIRGRSWSSSATASRRRSTSGTTSRGPISRARSSSS